MALERRGNGYYFYKKKRIGNRVVSVYSGGRELAQCFQILDQQRKEEAWLEKESKKRSFEAVKKIQAEIDQVIDAFCQHAKAFEEALYLINGYHVHSRQWRMKRNANKDETEET